jgi:hypothetical protein
MNFALVELGNQLRQGGTEPGDELVNPDKYQQIDSATVKLLRDNKSQSTTSALAAPPTDDDVLAIAEGSNIELDVVMQAAENCNTLRLLVMWAEEYQRQKSEVQEEKAIEAIRESVKRRIELEKLTQKEQELQERLVSALTPAASATPSISDIEKMLGIETPESVRNLAKSKYIDAKAPDFLSQARRLLQTK